MIPTLETDRLILRGPEAKDFDAYAAFRASDRAKMVGGPYSRAQAFSQFTSLIGHWTLRGYGRWVVADKATDETYGIVGLLYPEGWPEPELAWSLYDHGEGKGIAFEAAKAARAYAHETLDMPPLVSLVAHNNARSIALAKRLGAAYEKDVELMTFGPTPLYRHPKPEALQ